MTSFQPGSGDLTAIAALLARGYLRLTEKDQHCAISGNREPQIELDVSAKESPHVVKETA